MKCELRVDSINVVHYEVHLYWCWNIITEIQDLCPLPCYDNGTGNRLNYLPTKDLVKWLPIKYRFRLMNPRALLALDVILLNVKAPVPHFRSFVISIEYPCLWCCEFKGRKTSQVFCLAKLQEKLNTHLSTIDILAYAQRSLELVWYCIQSRSWFGREIYILRAALTTSQVPGFCFKHFGNQQVYPKCRPTSLI